MKLQLVLFALLLVSFWIETKSTRENTFKLLYKREADAPYYGDHAGHTGLYDHFKRFWKNSWTKTKFQAERIAGKVVRSVTGALTHLTIGPHSAEEDKGSGGIFGKITGGFKRIFKPKTRYEHREEEKVKIESTTVTTTSTTTTTIASTEKTLKEHGNFDFFGRDAIRSIGGFATKTGKKIEELVSSTVPGGLDVKNASLFGGAIEKFKDHVQAIYPGTLWCGDGNKAKDYDDLGHFNDTDACCREHDNCPDSIPAGSKKYGLENTGLFTRSNCECDSKFYNCLKKTDSAISKKIGFTFFTVLGPQCYKEERIISSCAKTEHGKCVEYEFKDSKEKRHQWFDSPAF